MTHEIINNGENEGRERNARIINLVAGFFQDPGLIAELHHQLSALLLHYERKSGESNETRMTRIAITQLLLCTEPWADVHTHSWLVALSTGRRSPNDQISNIGAICRLMAAFDKDHPEIVDSLGLSNLTSRTENSKEEK